MSVCLCTQVAAIVLLLSLTLVTLLQVDKLEKGHVYTAGCLKELTRLMDWTIRDTDGIPATKFLGGGIESMASSNVLYIGDSLFADLVDAKREFSWTSKCGCLFQLE